MVLGSLVLASQTFFIPTSSADYHQLADHLSTLGGSLVGVIITAFALSRFLPRMPLLNRMVLVPPGAQSLNKMNEPQLRPDLAASVGVSDSLLGPFAWLQGERGTTLTILRPSGKAQFGDRLVDVISDGPYIESGKHVQVIEVNGNRVVVRELA
jgi:membrane-bound serine protease (ClpP class)